MDRSAYLSRIHYQGPLSATAEVLRELQRAHLYSVPFENLDIHLGRPIQLEETALFDKIVTHRRGGFCYELNGLFSRLLEDLGFQVTLLNARSLEDDGSYGLEFDHLALLVRCPDDPATAWLADVGWGNGPLEPLRLDGLDEQGQDERLFKFLTEGEYRELAEQVEDESGPPRWIKHYAFTLRPHLFEDFFDCCRYHQTSPDSLFTRKRLCTLILPDGRITLSDMKLMITRKGKREERELSGEAEAQSVLAELFGVVL